MATSKASSKSRNSKSSLSMILFVIAIIIFATTLRTPLTAVGPIISDLQQGLGISYVLAGSLTTIPLLAFAIVSPFAPRISQKLGMEHTLYYSVILLTIGIIIRSLGTTSFLLIGTVLIGVAIAFGNVLIPGFFKLKYPYKIGLLMGLYSVSLNVSAGVSLGISKPIANTALGWQGALAFSVILTLITLIIWIPLLRGEKVNLNSQGNDTTATEGIKLWNSPLAWAIAFAMGFQSLLFYCSTTWLPEILISQGFSASSAGWMTSIMQYSQIPMTFLVPVVAEKLKSQRSIVFFFTFCYLVAFLGIFFKWTSLAIVWMIFLGLAGGASFGLAMMLFTLRTQTAYEASQISGFAQSVGYLLAAVGPILFGYLHDVTGSWDISNLLFIISAIVLFIFSFISAKERFL